MTAIADNLGREDLSAYEQALALREYASAFGLALEAAGAELGIERRSAYRLKAVLEASPGLQEAIKTSAVPAKPAAILAKIEQRTPSGPRVS